MPTALSAYSPEIRPPTVGSIQSHETQLLHKKWFEGIGERYELPITQQEELIGRQFYELAETWREQKGGLSLVYQKSMLPSYQTIIGLGHRVIPFILRELERQPDHWFWALEVLTKQNPVPLADRGNIRKRAHAWIEWGKNNRLI